MFDNFFIPVHSQLPVSSILPQIARLGLRANKPIHLLKILEGQLVPTYPSPGVITPMGVKAAVQKVSMAEEERLGLKEVETLQRRLQELTKLQIPVTSSVTRLSLRESLAHNSHASLLILPQQENPSFFNRLFDVPITGRLLGEVELPILILPTEDQLGIIQRVGYLTETPDTIDTVAQTIDALDTHHQPYIHVMLSYSGWKNLSEWDSQNLGATILDKISYPHIGLEVRGEKGIYEMAMRKVKQKSMGLLAIHYREMDLFLERFYMRNPSEKLAYESNVPLLIFPDQNAD